MSTFLLNLVVVAGGLLAILWALRQLMLPRDRRRREAPDSGGGDQAFSYSGDSGHPGASCDGHGGGADCGGSDGGGGH